MQVIWTSKEGRKIGETIKGRSFKKDDESFTGGVVFGDAATSLVHSSRADRLFEVEPVGDKTQIVLRTEPLEEREIRFLFWKNTIPVKEKNIYGRLWKATEVRVLRELDAVSFLSDLATHPDFWVRKAVAENPNTAPEVLQRLSSDQNGWVLLEVAINNNTDEQTRRKLCYCSDVLARAAAIRRAKLGFDILKDMEAKETEALPRLMIKRKIAGHRDTPIFSRVKFVLSGYF